ncbi:hypothetical protein, partial [Streptomyces ipomoeae]|uniref:hypothetical protein n=1 Tax=Streptomyces ipomoeae TaxID=103232 RepID=UPI0029ACE583
MYSTTAPRTASGTPALPHTPRPAPGQQDHAGGHAAQGGEVAEEVRDPGRRRGGAVRREAEGHGEQQAEGEAGQGEG